MYKKIRAFRRESMPELLILSIVLLLFLSNSLAIIPAEKVLFELDMYSSVSISQHIQEEGDLPAKVPYDSERGEFNTYRANFYILINELNFLLGADLFSIYKYFCIFMSSLIIILVFLIGRIMVGRKAIFSITLLPLMPVIFGRFVVSLAENLAMVFFLTSLYFLFKGKGEDALYSFMFILFAFFTMCTHQIGLFLIPFMILNVFYLARKRFYGNRLFTISYLLPFVYIIYFHLKEMRYYTEFINIESEAVGISNSLMSYLNHNLIQSPLMLGTAVILLGCMGLLAFIKDYEIKDRRKLILSVWLLWTFLLMNKNVIFQVPAPIWRYVVYFSFPLIIVSNYFFVWLSERKTYLHSAIVILLILSIMLPVGPYPKWHLWAGEKEAEGLEWIRTNTPHDSFLITHPIYISLAKPYARRDILSDKKKIEEFLLEKNAEKSLEIVREYCKQRRCYVFISLDKLKGEYYRRETNEFVPQTDLDKFKSDAFIPVVNNDHYIIYEIKGMFYEKGAGL